MFYEADDLKQLHSLLEKFACDLMRSGVDEEGIFACRLIVSELVGNVLRHSNEKATVEGEVQGDRVNLWIRSPHPFIPERIGLPDAYSEHGRGLYLVGEISEECSYTEGGVRVVIRFCR